MELMLAIMEYNYFKPAAGVSAERSIHNPSFDYERNKKCTMCKYQRTRRYCRFYDNSCDYVDTRTDFVSPVAKKIGYE